MLRRLSKRTYLKTQVLAVRSPEPTLSSTSSAFCQTFGRLAQRWFEVANAQPRQGGLYPVHNPRAFPHQAFALPIGPLGVLFGTRWHARHAAMAPFPTQPPQEPPLEQFGVQPVGLCPAMFPRHRHTRGMDHVRLYPAVLEPARPARPLPRPRPPHPASDAAPQAAVLGSAPASCTADAQSPERRRQPASSTGSARRRR